GTCRGPPPGRTASGQRTPARPGSRAAGGPSQRTGRQRGFERAWAISTGPPSSWGGLTVLVEIRPTKWTQNPGTLRKKSTSPGPGPFPGCLAARRTLESTPKGSFPPVRRQQVVGGQGAGGGEQHQEGPLEPAGAAVGVGSQV